MKQFLLSVLLFALLASCNKTNITEPEPEPGRRDYVWKADTIKVPFTYFNKIWGDASDNVWTVGPGGGLDKTIWKFDGIRWSTDGKSRGISPLCVWGFGKNDVWIAGREGRIWHYNQSWKESIWFRKTGWTIGFQDIYGDSHDNLYAVGYVDSLNFRKGIILKWNGVIWKEINIPTFPSYNFITIRKNNSENGNYFLLGWGEGSLGTDLLAIFEFDGININKIYEALFNNSSWVGIGCVGEKLLFIIGNKICKYTNGNFIPLFEVDKEKFNQGFWGRNEKDLFLSMKDGIAHYNGDDIQYLYRYNGNEHAFGMVILEKEVFVLTNDFKNYTNIIIRGKLQ